MLDLTIAQKTPLTKRISEFVLNSEDSRVLPSFEPGSHIDVMTPVGPRSYSLIGWPEQWDGAYRIAVQREDGGDGGSLAMHDLVEGQVIQTSLPKNDFVLSHGGKPVALLAGGIGVTPLISMASRLKADGHPFRFDYAGRSVDEMGYLTRLEAEFGDNLHAHFDDVEPLDLTSALPSVSDHALFICGPKGMIEAARAAAEAVGIASDDIHVELFTTAKAGTGDQPFEIEIASSGQVITIPADKTIIEALEESGLDPLYDCQRGDCGICQTHVVSGIPDHRDVVLSQAERDSGTVMQICVSRALSDRLVLDL